MAAFSYAMSRFLYGGHDQPDELKPQDLYDTPCVAQPKDDPKMQKDVFKLTLELLALKQDIDDAEKAREQVGEVLLPHKKRLQILVERHQHIKTFFEVQDQQDNVQLVVARIEQFESGIEEVHRRMNASAEAVDGLRSVHDGIVRRLMGMTQIGLTRKRKLSELDDLSLITERMIRPETVDAFEDQAAEVEGHMETEAAEQLFDRDDSDDCNDAFSFTSEDAEEQDRIELMERLGRLKFQRTTIKEELTARASAAEEIQALTRQINDLGDEIAIRGAPCVEGSIIFQDEFIGDENTTRDISRVHLREDINNVSDMAVGPSHETTKECASPGLFSDVPSIEAPEQMSQSDDGRFEPEAKKAERLQRARDRVTVWVNQLEVDDERQQQEGDEDIPDCKFEGMDRLESVIVGESDSVYNEDSSDFASMTIRCRIDSWNRICERQYLELDSDVQEAHPRGLVAK